MIELSGLFIDELEGKMKKMSNKKQIEELENSKYEFKLANSLRVIALLIILALAFSLSIKEVKAAQIKTVEYFIAQNGTQFASGTRNSIPFNIYIPESKIVVRSASVVINGVSTGAADLGIKANVSNVPTFYNVTLASAGETQRFTIKLNSSNLFSLAQGSNNFNLSFQGIGAVVSLQNAKAVITYEYNESEPIQLKTVNYYLGRHNGTISGGVVIANFTVCIPEDSPTIRSAFIELTATANGAADLVLHGNFSGGTGTSGDLRLSPGLDSSIATQSYIIYWNMSRLYSQAQGCTNYGLRFSGSGTPQTSISEMLVLTYDYLKTSNSQQKTVRQLITQNNTGVTSSTKVITNFSLYIPETSIQILSAFAYIFGWVGAVDNRFAINMTGSLRNETALDINTEGGSFWFLYNASRFYSLSSGTNSQIEQIMNVTGTTVNLLSSEAYITYNTTTPKKLPQQKTVEFFILQNNTRVAAKTSILQPFSIYIPEDILNITSFIIEVNAVNGFVTSANTQINVTLNNVAGAQKNYAILNTGETNEILLKHGVTNAVTLNKGLNNFVLNITYSSATLDAANAKAVITYNFTDRTAPTYSNPEWNDTNVVTGDNVSFNASWQDNYDLQWYIFSLNMSDGYRNSSKIPFSGNYNVSFNVTNITAATGANVSWLWYVNDSNGNLNQTNVSWFIVQAAAAPPDTVFPTYSGNNSNTTSPFKNDYISIYAVWTDETKLNYTWSGNNFTGIWINETPIERGIASINHTNITRITINEGQTGCYILYANDSGKNLNQTTISCITIAQRAPTYTSNNTNTTTPANNDYVIIFANWSDDTLLNFTWSENNFTGAWINETLVARAGLTSVNHTNITQVTAGEGKTVCYILYANDSYGRLNQTTQSCFTIRQQAPTYTSNNTNVTNPVNGSYVVIYANWTDDTRLNYTWAGNNFTGIWVNETPVDRAGLTSVNHTNITQVTIGADKTICYILYANDTSGNLNQTTQSCITTSAGNAVPQLIWVNQSVTADPVEASNITLQFHFNATDADGATTLDASSAKVEVKFNGINRTSFNCINVLNSSNLGVYNCSVQFAYFDNASASWVINASIRDNNNVEATNATGTFTYNTLSAFALKSTVVNFTGINLGDSNIGAATNPWIINNTGNDDFDNINITATDLRGMTTPSEVLGVGNITVNYSAQAPFGYAMLNNTQVRITGATLIHGDPSRGLGNLSLYFFISVPSSGLTGQDYNATIPWTIRAYNEP